MGQPKTSLELSPHPDAIHCPAACSATPDLSGSHESGRQLHAELDSEASSGWWNSPRCNRMLRDRLPKVKKGSVDDLWPLSEEGILESSAKGSWSYGHQLV